jgi:hypothetical protein
MGDPSAILAINSLDRYINTTIPVSFSAQCILFNGSANVIYNSFGVTPPVGSILTSNSAGFPAGVVTIVALLPGTNFTMSAPATATNLAANITISFTQSSAQNPTSNMLPAQYLDILPYSNNFTIQSPGALIYGYINRIIVSQIQLSYNIPTVCIGKNDTYVISTAGPTNTPFTIPHGFYYADELAAALQTQINADPTTAPLNMTVTFLPRDGFQFLSTANLPFYFPDPSNRTNSTVIYKTYRLLGMTVVNSLPAVNQTSFDYPNFLYTPYIDFYSDILTNYQSVKDTNTSVAKPKGLVARVYVSGTGQIQVTGSTSALGTAPFVMTSDLNTPKVIRWSPDVAVPSIDFQLLDQYGDLIPGADQGFSTEFQMTLLCVEGRDEA